MLLIALSSFAQDNESDLRAAYNKAESYYDIGRFDDAIKLLDENHSKFPETIKNNVLRLYALCYMATDNQEMCKKNAMLLLNANPGYTSVNDPPRFRDMIEELKKGANATISTASLSNESVEEAPVPVTVITEEMIRAAGAQTIQDALIAYVPGISVIEINGIMNFAYRGIYGLSQEKMLFMLNGIRLNSYYSNTAMTDYSISMEKIKQIEILRGPSSSLYGDVALTGVVNIITKDGSDLDGIEINAGVGNFGQLKASATAGKHIYDFDVFVWGAIYRSDGERAKGIIDTLVLEEKCPIDIFPENIIIGGYNNKPSFDYGINLKYKGLSVLYSCNSSKTVTPYTKSEYYFAPYSYYKYTDYLGNKPGPSYQEHNIKVMYEKDFGHLGISASASYNKEKMARYFVEIDSTVGSYSYYGYKSHEPNFNISEYYYTIEYYGNGLASIVKWEDANYTCTFNANYEYGNSRIGGSVILGIDYSFFKVVGIESYKIDHFTHISFGNESKIIEVSTEEPKNDFYLQIKQRLGKLIINSGLRFDYKKHCRLAFIPNFWGEEEDSIIDNRSKMKEFSPRISLIYMLNRFNFKFNYSKSFVDAPYLYRTNDFNVVVLGNVEPEKMHSFQLTASAKKFVKGLETELNFYYNKGQRLLNSETELSYNWDVTIIGAELVAKYALGKFNLNANLSFLKVQDYVPYVWEYEDFDDDEEIMTYSNTIFNVPNFTSNIVVGYKFFDKMRFNVNLYYTGRQYFKKEIYYEGDITIEKIPQVFLVSPSLNFDFKHFTFDISVHNAFNHKYSLGGKCIRPVQQKGAWLMLEAGYRF